MGADASGLAQIWHMRSEALMALASIGVLATFTALTVTLAMRAFGRSTLA